MKIYVACEEEGLFLGLYRTLEMAKEAAECFDGYVEEYDLTDQRLDPNNNSCICIKMYTT